jgi:glycosyltransferase involved in cell wall biosynthesis
VSTKIVGSNITDEVRALAQAGLEIVGFVEDTAPLLQSSKVSIAPLRYGAGVKGKVNEAMNHGIPVVATSCAVEGMHLEFGREVLVSDDALGFAEAIARAYNDEALWNTLSAAGINNVLQHFSMEAALPAVRRVFASTSK